MLQRKQIYMCITSFVDDDVLLCSWSPCMLDEAQELARHGRASAADSLTKLLTHHLQVVLVQPCRTGVKVMSEAPEHLPAWFISKYVHNSGTCYTTLTVVGSLLQITVYHYPCMHLCRSSCSARQISCEALSLCKCVASGGQRAMLLGMCVAAGFKGVQGLKGSVVMHAGHRKGRRGVGVEW